MADYKNKPFIEKLRMQKIFAPEGGLNPGTPFGMPNLSAGLINTNAFRDDILRENEIERNHELELARMRMQPALPQIAKQAIEKKPMNTVYQPSMTEYQRGTLAGRSLDRQSRENIAGGRLDLGREQIFGRYDLQGLRGDQRASQIDQQGDIRSDQIDQQGNIRTGQINRQGVIRGEQIDQQGQIGDRQIGLRQAGTEKLQEMKGAQGLQDIVERGRQTRLTKGSDSPSPGEVMTNQNLAIRKLQLSSPSLGKLISIGTNGQLEISPEATPIERQMITDTILAKGDRQLPSETPKYDNSSTAPKPRKYRSVSVE